jgi:RND family efflux transporter MFP subunit
MKPPTGAVPVAVTAAKRQPIDATVTYTGSAVSYIEQDVYPRVTGWIKWMPFYPGDHVRPGQVLARLDTTELQSRVNEREATRSMAEHTFDIAQRRYRQALAAKRQAQAQVTEARNDLASARKELDGARQEAQAALEEQASMQAELEGAQAGIEDAEAALAAAKADQEYWVAELKRSQALYASGAISLQEHQQDRAQAENANARARQAQARLQQVKAAIRSAKSRLHRAESMVAAAQARVSAMEARIQAIQAKVEQAQANARAMDAAADSVYHEIEHSRAGVQEAMAQLTTARVVAGYTEIRSEVEGVVTQRLISPGVLVSPGQPILKISQISPIRLQANVAESDLVNIRVGNRVRIRSNRDPKYVVQARVTSIFPAADPVARTAIVEAIIPNKDHHFLPGQYIIMDITTGENKNALVVPASALVWLPKASSDVLAIEQTPAVWVIIGGAAEKPLYICPMHPDVKEDSPGKCPHCSMDLIPQVAGGKWRAHLTEVRVGLVNTHYVEIRSGLKEGDQVIYAGHEMLKEGDPVVPAEWGPAGPLRVPPPTSTAPPGGAPSMKEMPRMQMQQMPTPSPDPTTPAQPSGGKRLYYCPMHPEATSTDPNATCQKCGGMHLQPKSIL